MFVTWRAKNQLWVDQNSKNYDVKLLDELCERVKTYIEVLQSFVKTIRLNFFLRGHSFGKWGGSA